MLLAIFLCEPALAQNIRQRQLLDTNWRFHLNELDGNSTLAPGGLQITQWVWIADNNAPTDASIMAAPGLNTSTWTNVTVGTDVFNSRVGYAWFRSAIPPLASSGRPLTLHFLNVDDNATVYLNGTLVGQHNGWGEAFDITLDPAWVDGATNFLAVAVQNIGGVGGIYGGVELQSGLQLQPPGMPDTQWVWVADDNAPSDATTMAAPALDRSTWTNVTIGQDVFQGRIGAAWFRTTLDPLALAGRPLSLHFLNVDDNATVYLNGALLGTHVGASQPFDLSPLDPAWNSSGPNVLAVAVQNNGGPGGLLGSVLLQSGSQIQPPGVPVTQWVWTPDDNATNDAPIMTATNLDTTTWQSAAIGQDVFSNHVGSAWFRAALDGLSTSGRPLTLHFLGVNDNATIYLNGTLLGAHTGAAQPFDIGPLDASWVSGGPNILAVAVQNAGGGGGMLQPVLLQSGEDIQDLAPTSSAFNDSAWRTVRVPHDYVVERTFTNTANAGHGSLPLATAWYRKSFVVPSTAQGQSVWLDFDGVYHNAIVWLNGQFLGKWHSGYAPFRYDISQIAVYGGTNTLAVHVDPNDFEGWWYEGAGIYRHVWLNIANSLHIAPWGTFVTAAVQGPDANGHASATLTITTTLTNAAGSDQSCALVSQVTGPDGVVVGTWTNPVALAAGTASNVVQTAAVPNALLWSIDTPQLYQLHTTVQINGQTVDNSDTSFGIRSLQYDINDGFFLNGQPLKLNGTCNHQDFAGVGIAMPDNLLYWRIKKLKEMGSNAYRCSHNPPTEALLDACDRLGMVVMDETRHLGDATGQKSGASTPYSDLSELNQMILRDRNHPSIIMWSMCNEESAVQGTQAGADLFYAMKTRVLQFDTSRPITCAMNGSWGTGITLVEDLQGCNYNPGGYDGFHASFPSMPMFASETTSATTDRGIYASDSTLGYVSSYNTTAENSWQPVGTRPFVAGGFVWTGFDYKGEPSPYSWPCINSHFGIMDMCGLPKDSYYYYRAWWGNQPSAYIFPHWNWPTPGQSVSVWCFANTETVELLLNGTSQGVQTVPAFGHVVWSVPYAAGTLQVNGYKGGALVVSNQVSTTGTPAALRLTTDRSTLTADGEDLTVVYAAVLDAQGRVVPTATNLVAFNLSGAGLVAGVGNGDPSSHEPDKGVQRHAFNGWCMALVAATNSPGAITVVVTSPGLASDSLSFQSNAANSPPATPLNLTAKAGNAQASLHWGLSFGASSYNIKRANVSGGPYTTIANYAAISYADTGLSNGSTYYYVVSALNIYGESTNSVEISATPAAPAPPATPTGLAAARDDGQVNLTWTASAGASSYNIKRSTANNGPYTNVATVAGTSFSDSGLTNGTTYYYVVSAVNSGLESGNSTQVSATPVSMSFLVGTIIGTPGSWNNSGNTRELAMDGNLSSFFDAPTNDNDYVGLDLGPGIARAVCKIRFAPRSGYASRMSGGAFQGANLTNFSDAVTFYTITNTPADGVVVSLFPTNTSTFRCLRYLSPNNGWGNIAELEFYSLGPHVSLLSGTIIGTSGSWNNSTNTKEKAMDGSITTYFDAPIGTGAWVGLDCATPRVVTNLRYFPRIGYAPRMNGGLFQGANLADFSDAVNLFALTTIPPDSTMTAQVITNSSAFRYVRYLSPTNGFCDVGEVQFFSTTSGPLAPPAPPGAPTGLTVTAGHAQAQLAWTATPGATNYNIKRGTVSGGPYSLVGSSTAVLHMDSGLPPGTYYYVVSASNSAGESPNSAEASVTLICSAPSTPIGLAISAVPGQLVTSWSPVSGATSYNVLRGTNAAGPYGVIATGIAAEIYADPHYAPGIAYFYAFQAVNSCGPSAPSAAVSITPLPLPSLSVSSSPGQLRLAWPAWAGIYSAYSAPGLAPPIPWQPLAITPQSSNGNLYLNLSITNTSQQFYRLHAP
jgi:beta-galactosidase